MRGTLFSWWPVRFFKDEVSGLRLSFCLPGNALVLTAGRRQRMNVSVEGVRAEQLPQLMSYAVGLRSEHEWLEWPARAG